MDGRQASAVTSTAARRTHEGTDLAGILDALAGLHPAADIHRIGPYPGNRSRNVLRVQATGKDHRLFRSRRHQRPVESLPGAPRHTLDIGVQENAAGPRVSADPGADVIARPDPQRLDIGAIEALALLGGLIAVELQEIQRHPAENPLQLHSLQIDKQAYRGHKWWQSGNDGSRLLDTDSSGTPGVKHQANGIGTGSRCREGVLDPGYSANLDTNSCQRADTFCKRKGDGNKGMLEFQPQPCGKADRKCGPR